MNSVDVKELYHGEISADPAPLSNIKSSVKHDNKMRSDNALDAELRCAVTSNASDTSQSVSVPSQITYAHFPGLKNLGNTCFLNAVMQALVHCSLFTDAVLSSTHADTCTSKDCVLCGVEAHIRLCVSAKASRRRSIAPDRVAHTLPKISTTLQRGRQEDAHEFLRNLISGMQNSLEVETRKTDRAAIPSTATLSVDSNALSAMEGIVSEAVSKPIAQARHLSSSQYPFRLFQGSVRSHIECDACGTVSTKEDPIEDLAVDISRASNLQETLSNEFCVDDELSQENAYYCDTCARKVVRAVKRNRLQDIPQVLTIQLKRFAYEQVLQCSAPVPDATSDGSALSDSVSRSRTSSISSTNSSPCPTRTSTSDEMPINLIASSQDEEQLGNISRSEREDFDRARLAEPTAVQKKTPGLMSIWSTLRMVLSYFGQRDALRSNANSTDSDKNGVDYAARTNLAISEPVAAPRKGTFYIPKKIAHFVHYPEYLDLQPYMQPVVSASSEGSKYNTKEYSAAAFAQLGATARLQAVVVHQGLNVTSGHYVAYVRQDASEGLHTSADRVEPSIEHQTSGTRSVWYRMDDTKVTQCSIAEAMSQCAYMLFYERCHGDHQIAASIGENVCMPTMTKAIHDVSVLSTKPGKRNANQVNILGPNFGHDGNSGSETDNLSLRMDAENALVTNELTKKRKTNTERMEQSSILAHNGVSEQRDVEGSDKAEAEEARSLWHKWFGVRSRTERSKSAEMSAGIASAANTISPKVCDQPSSQPSKRPRSNWFW